MAEYIERGALLEDLRKSRESHAETSKDFCLLIRCERIVREQLVADVMPVRHGEWLDMQEDDNTEGMWRCSACGEDRYFPEGHPREYEFRFCPYCGCKMDLGGAENA